MFHIAYRNLVLTGISPIEPIAIKRETLIMEKTILLHVVGKGI